MSTLQINNILDKLDELRAVFILGQRALPFLEDMFIFLKDISGLFDEINASIQESTTNMPHATMSLESVSQATEMATTEILDLADGALMSLNQSKKRFEESASDIDGMAKADARLIRLLRAALRGKDELLLAKVDVIHQEKKALRRNIGAQVQKDIETVNDVRTRLNHIMIALQVQDITAQQLASVHHLIESIRSRLGSLMVRLGADIDPDSRRVTSRRVTSFDPNARYDRSDVKQNMADQVISSFGTPVESSLTPEANAVPPSTPVSATDIDQLFSKDATSAPVSAPASQDAIDQLFDSGGAVPPVSTEQEITPEPTGDGSAPASQDAIDQLFGGGGAASQDAIDKLFGGA